MRKYILFMGILLGVHALWAITPPEGRYRYELNVRFKGTDNWSSRCSNYHRFYVTYVGSAEVQLQEQSFKDLGIEKTWKDCPPFVFYEKASRKISSVRFFGKRKWRNQFGCKGTSGNTDQFPFFSYYPCGVMDLGNCIPKWDSYVTLRVAPEAIQLYYHDYLGNYRTSGMYLTDRKQITIKATTGFERSTYAWMYAVKSRESTESWENVSWKAIPAAYCNGSVATFSGNDLMGAAAFREVLAQKKMIAVKIAGCTESPLMIMDPRLYGPKIVKVEKEPASCSYTNDGKFRVYFDRALLPGEMVEVALRKKPDPVEIFPPLEKDSVMLPIRPDRVTTYAIIGTVIQGGRFQNEESVVEVTGVSSGEYTVHLTQGGYPDDYPSYVSDANDHETGWMEVKKTSDPVLQKITSQEVACYGGENGKIVVQAGGGRGDLFLLYSDRDSIAVSREAETTLTGLKGGNYQIRLHGLRMYGPGK